MSIQLKLDDGTWTHITDASTQCYYSKDYMDTNAYEKANGIEIQREYLTAPSSLYAPGVTPGTIIENVWRGYWLSKKVYFFSANVSLMDDSPIAVSTYIPIVRLTGATFKNAAISVMGPGWGLEDYRRTAVFKNGPDGGIIYFMSRQRIVYSYIAYLMHGALTLAS